MFKRILQEPLLHFVVVGSLLFFYLSTNDTVIKPQVIISEGKINQLTAQFTKTRQRKPLNEELTALIESQIREDLAFEHGVTLGLVENDSIIKRRVQQKIEFMLNDSIASIEPTQEELQAFMDKHKERYSIAPVYTFKHIYINPEKHVELDAYIESIKEEDLNLVYNERGDSVMIESRFSNITTAQIARILGLKFAKSLDDLSENRWVGPVISGYGVHLVYIENKEERHLVTLKELESKVKLDFRVDAQKKAINAFYEELKHKYDLVIETEAQ